MKIMDEQREFYEGEHEFLGFGKLKTDTFSHGGGAKASFLSLPRDKCLNSLVRK